MTFDEYQAGALTTALKTGDDIRDLCHWTLGLTGESGEVAEKVKKVVRGDSNEISPELRDDLIKEAGDVLWYLAVFADHLGVGFDELAKRNLDKLHSRQERGTLRGSGDDR